jgi:hypothetical protein
MLVTALSEGRAGVRRPLRRNDPVADGCGAVRGPRDRGAAVDAGSRRANRYPPDSAEVALDAYHAESQTARCPCLGQSLMHAGDTIDRLIDMTFAVPTRTDLSTYAGI